MRERERASRIFLGDVTVDDHHACMHAFNPLHREPPDRRWHFILVRSHSPFASRSVDEESLNKKASSSCRRAFED